MIQAAQLSLEFSTNIPCSICWDSPEELFKMNSSSDPSSREKKIQNSLEKFSLIFSELIVQKKVTLKMILISSYTILIFIKDCSVEFGFITGFVLFNFRLFCVLLRICSFVCPVRIPRFRIFSSIFGIIATMGGFIT